MTESDTKKYARAQAKVAKYQTKLARKEAARQAKAMQRIENRIRKMPSYEEKRYPASQIVKEAIREDVQGGRQAEIDIKRQEKLNKQFEKYQKKQEFQTAHPTLAGIQAGATRAGVTQLPQYGKAIGKFGKKVFGGSEGKVIRSRGRRVRPLTPYEIQQLHGQATQAMVTQRTNLMPPVQQQDINSGNFGYRPSYREEDYTPEESHGGFFIPTNRMPQQKQDRGSIIKSNINPNPFFTGSGGATNNQFYKPEMQQSQPRQQQFQNIQQEKQERGSFFKFQSKNKVNLT